VYLAQDWIAGLGIVVLWVIWKTLFVEGDPPVLAMALSFQWVQVTAGVYYFGLTGRQVEAMHASDYRPMVFIGLGCVTALLFGIGIGLRASKRKLAKSGGGANFAFSWKSLFIGYVGSIFLNAVLVEVAWQVPLLTQGILAISFLRLGLLYLIFRRLTQPSVRWSWFIGILGVELALGFSGFFASFREPLVLAALALIECFDRRHLWHWVRLAALGASMILFGMIWLAIRDTVRKEYAREGFAESRTERLETVGSLSSEWFEIDSGTMVEDLDRLVERLWTIYYPALAVSRVPDVLPHENGAIMLAAVKHIFMPRVLFPEKEPLPSDSEMVRKYTGIPVASTDQNTSIAFGYAAEAYVDFGLPWMFLPSLLYGIFMGVAYRLLYRVIHHRELAVALVSVVFWLSLYLFERSWIKTFGLTLTLIVYLGAVVWLLDRHFSEKAARRSSLRGRSVPYQGGRVPGSASPSRF
jgi:hypothetical protein